MSTSGISVLTEETVWSYNNILSMKYEDFRQS